MTESDTFDIIYKHMYTHTTYSSSVYCCEYCKNITARNDPIGTGLQCPTFLYVIKHVLFYTMTHLRFF